MKREDFTIDGIPEGYIVYDVDLTPSGRPVAGLAHSGDQTAPAYIRTADSAGRIGISDEALWPYGDKLTKPLVRAAGETQVVAVRRRARANDDTTVRVWTSGGQLVSAFHGGDDVDEALACERFLVLFYGDEGQLGSRGLSSHAMAVLSESGTLLWGHASQFPDRHLSVWFHAASWLSPDEVVVCGDVRDGAFADGQCSPLILDLKAIKQSVWKLPSVIGRPTAVTVLGDRALMHGFRSAADHVTPVDDIVQWAVGSDRWETVGSFAPELRTKRNALRGLPGGRFIAPKPDGYTILSFD